MPPERAAAAAGVPKRTWQNWLREGRRPDAVEPYRSVAERVDVALAMYHESLVETLSVGMEKDPRLSLQALERRFPDDWADKSKSGVTINLGVILQSPEWLSLREGLLSALSSHPAALDAVVGFLGGQQTVDGVVVAELDDGAEVAA